MKIMIFLFLLALMSAPSTVGFTVEITGVTHKADIVWYVDVARRGRTQVSDSSSCGAPPIGAAYAQYVQMDDGMEYRTLYAGGCGYPILP